MKRQITAWILLAAMLAGLLSGCGQNAADTSQADSDGLVSKYAYQVAYLDFEVDEEDQFQGVDRCCISESNVFFVGTCITGKVPAFNEATGAPVIDTESGEQVEYETSETALYRMRLDTRETVRLDYHPIEPPEGMLGDAHILSMAAGLDGTFWIMEGMYPYAYDLPEDFDAQQDQVMNYYVAGDYIMALRQYDADGQLLKTLDLSGLLSEGAQMLFDQDGNIYLNTYETVYLLDSEGVLLAQLKTPFFGPLYQISATEIAAFEYDGGIRRFRLIDPAAQDYGKEIETALNAYALYPGVGDYRYLYADSAGTVYGVQAETQEPEKLFSWQDCDVSGDNISSFALLEDGSVAAITWTLTKNATQFGLLWMEPVDPSTLPQKQTLTLAGVNLSSELNSAVTAFNQLQSSVRIVVKDYSQYNTTEDASAGLTRLNTELLSGNIPDLLCTDGLPVDQYASKQMLADLWPMIDSDTELSREDLMTHLFDVLSSDGKLYQITSAFSIWTAVGDANVIGDRSGWTLEEVLEAMEAMPDSTAAFGTISSKSTVLIFCLRLNAARFIDWENQTCSFESPEFLNILNFANSFPAKFAGDASETTLDRFIAGKQLLMNTNLTDFGYMQVNSAMVGGNPCYVGYPSSIGSGSSFYISGGLAITSACQDTDAAWRFLRTFLTEDYQSSILSGFPTNRHAFEALVEREMDLDEYTHGTWQEEGIAIEREPLTQEEYDMFMRLYESCGSVFSDNDIVYDIIAAEAAPFFDGQKTAEEAAALIQNRVGLYVMEQK